MRSIRRGRALRALHVNPFLNTPLEHRYSKTFPSDSDPAALCEANHLRSTQPSTRQAAAVGGPHTAGAGAPAPHPFRALRALALLSFTGRWRALVSYRLPGAGAPSLFRSPSWGGVLYAFTEGLCATSCSAECTSLCDGLLVPLRSLARPHPAGGDCVVAVVLFPSVMSAGTSVVTVHLTGFRRVVASGATWF